jgi:hypothetical protein
MRDPTTGWIACGYCREEFRPKEEKVAETKCADRKCVLELTVFEIPTKSGKDYEVEVSGSLNGMHVSYKTSVEKVREFFTKPKEA